MSNPSGVVIDWQGNILLLDSDNSRVQIYGPELCKPQ